MPFFLDTQETTQRFANRIAEFCSLLDTNHVRHGSPDDFFEFANTLEKSNLFRLDLSALVKSVVKKESDELLLTDMMSIIAASVGGPSFADTHIDITKPTNVLMEFLLGTGCWKQFGSPSLPASQSAASPHRPSVRTEEPRPMRISHPASPIPITNENPEERAALLDASSELRQTLTRLELNTLQVKLHLDSIEQRISRIEPSSDALSTRAPSPPEPLLHHDTADPVADKTAQFPAASIPAYETELPTRGRAVFSHLSHPSQSQTEDNDFSSPTFAYASEKGRSIIPIGVFLVLLAMAVASLFFIHSGQRDALLKAATSRLKTVRALFSSVPATLRPAPAITPPPTPRSTPTSPIAAPTPSSPTTPLTPTKEMAEATSTPSAGSDGSSPNIPPKTQPISDNPKIRYIPANIMAGHLLSAPRPEYPSLARIDHIEGQVVLQATISKTGSIKTMHVIQGPSTLRSAAIDAVRNWEYKPYLADGRPIEVATTIYVDFSLKPPPKIVR